MKNIYKIAFLGVFILASGMIFKSSSRDLTSKAYLDWKAQHEYDLEFNRIQQKLILDPSFHFDHLELVEVSPGPRYFSLWGHMMMRLAGSGGSDPDQDLVLSFLADFNDFPVDDYKASTGGYVVLPKIRTVAEYKKEYIVGEGRTISFYPVHGTKEQEQLFLKVLRQWIIDPTLPGGYSFFYNNCVTLMTKILVESTLLPKMGIYGYWPKYVPRQYAEVGLIDYE